LGTIGRYHLANLPKIDNTELVGVCDIKNDVAETTVKGRLNPATNGRVKTSHF